MNVQQLESHIKESVKRHLGETIVIVEGVEFTMNELNTFITEHAINVIKEMGEPLGYDIGENLVSIIVNNEHFTCIKTQSESDKRKGTFGFIVYDEGSNLIGNFNHVRSLEELEYLVEKKLEYLQTKPILTPSEQETAHRRGIKNPHLEEEGMYEQKTPQPVQTKQAPKINANVIEEAILKTLNQFRTPKKK